MTGNTSETKLAAAAEELVKTLSGHVESTSLSIEKEAVEELKASMDSKFDTLNQNILNLKEGMDKLNSEIATQAKNHKLEWAFANAGIGSFNYYSKSKYRTADSSNIVKQILFSFRQGVGHYINDCSITSYNCGRVEEGEKKFREALKDQVHDLLGHEPRIELADDGYLIYYS